MQHSQRVHPEIDNYESKRNDRNQTEKKRRGRFNGLIDELAVFLADRCYTKKSTEKSSILKLTGEYFLEQEKLAVEKAAKEWFKNVKPAFVTDDEFNFVYLESMNMLIFALDQTGQVVYVSDNVQACLGHLPHNILERNVFEFIGTRDAFIFQRILSTFVQENAATRHSQRFEPFWCQFRRGSYDQGKCFETIHCFVTILGNFPKPPNGANLEVSECILVLAKPLNSFPIEKTLLTADGPQTIFTATLNMEGKYDYLDKRVTSVLGFFPSELIGSSLYEYCHIEDLQNLVEYHRWLLLTGKITTCYYRHLTKAQSWIWLQSRYDLSYSDWNSKPQAVTCLSWVVSCREVYEKQTEILARDKHKFASIRAGSNEGNDEELNNSSNISLTAPETASQGCASEITETSVCSVESLTGKPTLEEKKRSLSARSLESRSNCTSPFPYKNNLEDSQLIDMQESFQFLNSINLPPDLTHAQHSLHQFLEEKYVQVINTITKQTEELSMIQKQIEAQGELRDLIERLEKERSANKVKNEYSTIKEMRAKFEELRKVSAGSRAEKTTAESSALCSARLQEMEVESSPEELNSTENPREEKQAMITGRQQNIFYDQERWLQTQAEQVQLQQQAFLMQQTPSSQSQHMPQEQLMLYRQQLLAKQFQQQQQHQQQRQQQLQQQQQQQQLHQQQLQQLQQRQRTSPMNAEFPQERLPAANGLPYSNNLQQTSPCNHFAQSPCSSESLYDYVFSASIRIFLRLLVVCLFFYGPTSVFSKGKRTHNCGTYTLSCPNLFSY